MLNLAESKGFNKDNPDVAKEIITYFSAEMQLSASYDTALDSLQLIASTSHLQQQEEVNH